MNLVSSIQPDWTLQQLLLLFSTGVGRDVELIGTSLDITPYDLPSIYLKQDQLSNLLDEPAFEGFSMNNGAFHIITRWLFRGHKVVGERILEEMKLSFPYRSMVFFAPPLEVIWPS